jgi:hypothetical protein
MVICIVYKQVAGECIYIYIYIYVAIHALASMPSAGECIQRRK